MNLILKFINLQFKLYIKISVIDYHSSSSRGQEGVRGSKYDLPVILTAHLFLAFIFTY